MSDPLRHGVEVEVRYAETDQMGVVHHANYLVWFELARTGLCRESGHSYADIERRGYLLMVTGAELRYRAGARYGDTVRVTVWLEDLTSRTLRFAYRVERDGELLVTGHTEHLWIDAERRRPCRIPDFVAPAFRRLSGREEREE